MKPGRKSRFIELLLHPAMLALPVAVLIILALPDMFKKYTIGQVKEQTMEKDRRKTYTDLDKDGNSEAIITKNNLHKGSSVIIELNGSTIDQWNLPGIFNTDGTRIITGDVNRDGVDEIYALVYQQDSLMLYGIDFRIKGRFVVSGVYVAPVQTDKNLTMRMSSGQIADLNGDGDMEIVFLHTSGYGLVPRRVFAVDLKTGTVNSSDDLFAYLFSGVYTDLDNDGKTEVLVSNYASANYKVDSLTPGNFYDHASYILALDHDLKLMFEPKGYSGDFSGCSSFPMATSQGKRILSVVYIRKPMIQQVLVQLLDLQGRTIRQNVFETKNEAGFNVFMIRDHRGHDVPVVNYNLEKMVVLNQELLPHKTIRLKGRLGSEPATDYDQDGKPELLFFTEKPGEIMILRADLSHPASFMLPPFYKREYVSIVSRKGEQPVFLIQSDNRLHYLRYAFNPLYLLRFPVYLMIYLGVLLFIVVIRNLQRIQLRRKFETEKRMVELQLLSLRNQMDPHFTFNVLNTIGSVILQSRREESYDMLMKFSKLIRTSLGSANQLCRPLEDELNFVTNYLALQQIRYEHSFTYKIQVEPGVNTLHPVPKMVLQTYVENALKHGLVPKRGAGELLVVLARRNQCLELSVTDNGVGRLQAKANGSISTGMGLSIINQYYQALNRNNAFPITETFTDLVDENGHPAGTRVVVCIPEGFVFPGEPEGR